MTARHGAWTCLVSRDGRPPDSDLSASKQLLPDVRIESPEQGAGLVISEEAAEHLVTLRSELAEAKDENTYYEYLEIQYSALEKCIMALRGCAKKDLDLHHRWWRL